MAVAGWLVACSSSKPPEPAPLEALPAGAKVLQPLWSQHLGSALATPQLQRQGHVLLASTDDGQVAEIGTDDGRVMSKLSVGAALSASASRNAEITAVVTDQNELRVFSSGRLSWQTRLPSQVVTAPLVAGGRVFVLSVDRSVFALDAVDGRKLWSYQRPSEALALRQAGVLVAVDDTLWAGVGSRLTALDPTTGGVRQEVVIGTPRGTNEVERLADLVAPAARVSGFTAGNDVLCVRAYQLSIGCVQLGHGELLWSSLQDGLSGVGADQEMAVGADGGDRLTAWTLTQGQPIWRNERLSHRKLSAAAVLDAGVVVGDGWGYLHVLDRGDGHVVGRTQACSAPVAQLLRVEDGVVAWCQDGTLAAYRLR